MLRTPGASALATVLLVIAAETPARAASYGPASALDPGALANVGADHHPELALDARGCAIVVWTSTDTLGGTKGSDADVLFARSSDRGSTWSAPQPITTRAYFDQADDRAPHVATDGNGHWMVVWSSSDALDESGQGTADRDILFVRSVDDGQTWTEPQRVDGAAALDLVDDRAPRVAYGDDTWVVSWQSGATVSGVPVPGWDLFAARAASSDPVWSAPVRIGTVSFGSADELAPALTWAGASTWLVAWTASGALAGLGADLDVVYARSLDDGITWSSVAPISGSAGRDLGDDREVDLASDGAGHVVAVWSSRGFFGPDFDVAFERSLDAGATWSGMTPIYSFSYVELEDEAHPRIATDGQGTWDVVWSRQDSNTTMGEVLRVLQSRSIDGGFSWSAPSFLRPELALDTGFHRDPTITSGGPGEWMTTWDAEGGLGGAFGLDLDILIVRQVCGDGIVQLGEECDDGNTSNADCCTSACRLVPLGAPTCPLPDAGVVDAGWLEDAGPLADSGALDGAELDAGPLPDAGEALDVGSATELDGGAALDAGSVIEVDAGEGPDGGSVIEVDAGEGPDGGVGADAASWVDAGLEVDGSALDADASLEPDGGSLEDASGPIDPDGAVATDGALPEDAGLGADAAVRSDATGGSPMTPGDDPSQVNSQFVYDDDSCQCSTTHEGGEPSSRTWAPALLLLGLLLHRRRHR